MAQPLPGAIYMIKKSADGLIVSFRLGTADGVRAGMSLTVVNEDGFRVGTVEVVSSTETESEALAVDDRSVKLGCRVRLPSSPASPQVSPPSPDTGSSV
jgi:hypothetical protein